MAYSIKKHEVDRLLSVLLMLGWRKEEEKDLGKKVTLVISKEFSDAIIEASNKIVKELDKSQ